MQHRRSFLKTITGSLAAFFGVKAVAKAEPKIAMDPASGKDFTGISYFHRPDDLFVSYLATERLEVGDRIAVDIDAEHGVRRWRMEKNEYHLGIALQSANAGEQVIAKIGCFQWPAIGG